MLTEAQDLHEYAFALGSLAHYAADNVGHRLAVTKSVPLLYSKVRRKFGPVATYEDNKTDHLRVECAFDVAQVAEQRYAPNAYHAFIGFEVSKPLLERSFQATYGVPLTKVSKNIDLALGTYRWTVSTLIPEMTRVAWDAKKKEILKTIRAPTAASTSTPSLAPALKRNGGLLTFVRALAHVCLHCC